MKKIFFLSLFVAILFACRRDADTVVTIGSEVINDSYIGNGVQWDPYELNYTDGRMTISPEDIDKLYRRLDMMKPPFMRVMVNTTEKIVNGKFDPTHEIDNLAMILDYCQSRGVRVMFGDWGRGLADSKTNSIYAQNIDYAAQYVNYLINDRGYSCIKNYNIVNEPNGFWSVIDGKYSLWADAVREMQRSLERYSLNDKVSIVGPDAAIWSQDEAWWIDSCANDLKGIVGLYDIHTYPSKFTVNSGEYSNIISAYKKNTPEGSQIVMGEIGLKFVAPEDSLYAAENTKRIGTKSHASATDSQMFVYDYMYGTDMADAIMQTANCGFSGCVAWMLDDAMHSNESPDKLKIWGFWNILGDEKFGATEEEIRPWFYAISLMTRYMPAGSSVRKVDVQGNTQIKAVAVEYQGKQMFAVVNVGKQPVEITIKGDFPEMKNANQFIYGENILKLDGENLLPNASGLNISFKKGLNRTIDGENIILYTNIEN